MKKLMRKLWLLGLLPIVSCTAGAMITTYNVQLPSGLYTTKSCDSSSKLSSFQYTALYKTDDVLYSKEQIKQDAKARLKHYYGLAPDFELKNCLKEEKINIQPKYNVSLRRDSTDLLPEANQLLTPQTDINIEIREK